MKTLKKIFEEVKKHTIFQNKKMLAVSIATFVLIIIVVAFSQQDIVTWEKLDFFVETKTIEDFNNEIEINKPGKIVGAEEIVISSQAMWTVKDIKTKEWDDVENGSILVELNDNLANYGIMVEKARNALNTARLQYWQNKNQLEQTIKNNQIALESSQNNLNTTQTLSEQNIKSAENNLKTVDSQKNSIILQMESEKTKLKSLLDNVLHQNDTILWTTSKYKTMNDNYEIYLSAKNTSFKLKWQKELSNLYKQKDVLDWMEISQNITNKQIKENIEKMDTIYKDIKNHLETMQNIFTNSVSSTSFPQTQIDWLIANNNWLQSSMQWNFSVFTNLKQTVESSFIEKDWEIKIIWSESTTIWYQSTLASTEQQLSNANIGLKTAELNYQSILENKENTLWLAAANIKNAELAYQEALKQYEKLKIKAPITWNVWKILVDKWQEISMWVPILTIINNSDPIVEIWVNSKELEVINSWSTIKIDYMWKTLSWEIISIWSQAWKNWLYNVIIKLKEKIEIIGDTAKIRIYNKNQKLALPINIVNPLEENNWYIYVIKNWEPEILNITFGEVWWDKIEIITQIPKNTEIITNNISNYNPNIHDLKIEN